jgi:hypothetical protein
MPKFVKFLLLAIPLSGFTIFEMRSHFKSAERFSAEGVVTTAIWNTKNHNMSLFEIQTSNGSLKKLHHSRVTLTPDQIKIGDHFKKHPDSKSCFINEIEIRCIR